MKNINVALLGFGTVGSGVAEAIRKTAESWKIPSAVISPSVMCWFVTRKIQGYGSSAGDSSDILL